MSQFLWKASVCLQLLLSLVLELGLLKAITLRGCNAVMVPVYSNVEVTALFSYFFAAAVAL